MFKRKGRILIKADRWTIAPQKNIPLILLLEKTEFRCVQFEMPGGIQAEMPKKVCN